MLGRVRRLLERFGKLSPTHGVLALVLLISIGNDLAHGQAASASSATTTATAETLQLSHKAITPEKLPFPGQKLSLTLTVAGTRDHNRRVRMIGAIDGHFTEQPATRSSPNENDQPVYEFDTVAPIAEIAYQFVVYAIDGSIASISPRYYARRNCLPRLELAPIESVKNAQPKERLINLVSQVNSLGDELASYDAALAGIEALRTRLGSK